MDSRLLALLLMLLALVSCSDKSLSRNDGENGIYYWRTTLDLSDKERSFLKKHNVGKLYLKFFDVDRSWDSNDGYSAIPQATIQFNDSLPKDVEVIPAVYITTGAIEEMQLNEDEYAEKILKRVNAMCRRNGIEFKELQLDCDWTKSTRPHFFKLCEKIKQRLDSSQILSGTIRLHQLTQTPPPVDKGVLMVYNTGNLMEMTTDNSIFSLKDIEPYLRDRRLANYSLPLDVAYPAYGWSILYRESNDKYKFARILRQMDFSGYPGLKKIRKNMYEATERFSLDQQEYEYVWNGDRIRVERPKAREILKVKDMIEDQLKGKPHNTILYHLDESQLSHYSDNEINKIYSRD